MVVVSRKIAVLGYPCVGKSSITLRFVNGTFPSSYDTTVEDYHTKVCSFHGKDYNLRITDTAGLQGYSLLPRSCVFNVDGYILVYSIDDRRSFETLETIYDKIRDSVGDGLIPIVIVGNKSDLQNESRHVTREEGEELARKWEAIFLESSAKNDVISFGPVVHIKSPPIYQIFEKALQEIEISKGNMQRPGARGKSRKCVLC